MRLPHADLLGNCGRRRNRPPSIPLSDVQEAIGFPEEDLRERKGGAEFEVDSREFPRVELSTLVACGSMKRIGWSEQALPTNTPACTSTGMPRIDRAGNLRLEIVLLLAKRQRRSDFVDTASLKANLAFDIEQPAQPDDVAALQCPLGLDGQRQRRASRIEGRPSRV